MNQNIYIYILINVLYLAFLHANHRRLMAGEPPVRASKWSYSDAWPMVNGVAIITIIGTGMMLHRNEQSGKGLLNFWGIIFPSTLVQNAGMVIMTLWCIYTVYQISREELGFNFNLKELGKGIAIGVPTFVGIAVLALVTIMILMLLFGQARVSEFLEYSNRINQSGQILKMLKSPVDIGGFIVMVSVFAPIGEEFFFRGWLFNMIKHRSGRAVMACWVSGLIFALIHISPMSILMIVPLGAWLAWNYHTSGNIWKNIGIHASYNLMMVVVALVARYYGHDLDKVL